MFNNPTTQAWSARQLQDDLGFPPEQAKQLSEWSRGRDASAVVERAPPKTLSIQMTLTPIPLAMHPSMGRDIAVAGGRAGAVQQTLHDLSGSAHHDYKGGTHGACVYTYAFTMHHTGEGVRNKLHARSFTPVGLRGITTPQSVRLHHSATMPESVTLQHDPGVSEVCGRSAGASSSWGSQL